MTSPITTHVLDLRLGKPAGEVIVHLLAHRDGQYVTLASGQTDHDGRIKNLLSQESIAAGCYRLVFEVADYFRHTGADEFFYPSITIDFFVHAERTHYHVPLLLSPFGYSTYRGS